MYTNSLRHFFTTAQRIKFFAPLLLLVIISGCTTETIFKSNFSGTALNSPPSSAQDVGTIALDAPAGLIKVVASPTGNSDKWVQITRPNNQSPTPGMKCSNSKFPGYGQYYFSCYMFMPSGSGLATIQFEPAGQPVSSLINFMHIDFMQDNTVRIDDMDATKFGTFPRDRLFSVLVSLNLAATGSTAYIALGGDGASGSANYNIPSNPFINQFGAVRLWMGFPWTGSFYTYNIVTTHKTS